MGCDEREYRREAKTGFADHAQRKWRTAPHSRRANRDRDHDLLRRFNGGDHDVSDAE